MGIDVYWPLADWRDGTDHLDARAGATSIYDLGYLKSNIFGGEGYDWYYRNAGDRAAQVRTPIADGGGKPWLFRFKDIRSWWSNAHFDRPAGVESATPTGWRAQGKPIWFMEAGCHVFVDPKSAESMVPYFSSGDRDDYMQRRYLQALIETFDPAATGFSAAMNPTSSVYGGPMVDPARIHIYAWDARPYPAFPVNVVAWGDAGNWLTGHWLNGRAASAPLPDTVAHILKDASFTDFDVSQLHGVMAGFVLDRILSVREALQPLSLAFFFDAVESDGVIRFAHRGLAGPVAKLRHDELVEAKVGLDPLTLTRAQESDLPASAKISYVAATGSYPPAIVESRRIAGASGRVATADLAIVLDPAAATAIADSWLHEAWVARETAEFALPPSRLSLEPGDVIEIAAGGRNRQVRLTEVVNHNALLATALSIDPALYGGAAGEPRPQRLAPLQVLGQPIVSYLDLPMLTADGPATGAYVAALQNPWPGAVVFYRSPETSGFTTKATATLAATMGVTLGDLPAGPTSRWDRANKLTVKIDAGQLVSESDLALFGGANAAAVEAADGVWEVLQFQTAVLVSPGVYELSRLLRGQGGTEAAMATPIGAGARFVLLDQAVTPVAMSIDEIGGTFNWKAGPLGRDISSASFAASTHAFRGIGLRPYSPVQVSGRRQNGDLEISWIRRTRISGDGWELAEVPLGEDAERYEVDILAADGTTVLRTLPASQPSVEYTAAAQTADFGTPQPVIAVRVYQLSLSFGRGTPSFATI